MKLRTLEKINFDIEDYERQLEYAETHKMWNAVAKIEQMLRELNLELENVE